MGSKNLFLQRKQPLLSLQSIFNFNRIQSIWTRTKTKYISVINKSDLCRRQETLSFPFWLFSWPYQLATNPLNLYLSIYLRSRNIKWVVTWRVFKLDGKYACLIPRYPERQRLYERKLSSWRPYKLLEKENYAVHFAININPYNFSRLVKKVYSSSI